MAARASLIISIGGEISSLDRATKAAAGKIRGLASDFQSIGSGFTLGITAPLVALGRSAIIAGSEIESLKLALGSLEGSAAGAEKRFRELQVVAKLPGLGIEEAVRGELTLRGFGLTAEKSGTALLAFGNALAAVGRGKADLPELTRQFGQFSTSSKILAENLKPIQERLPQVNQILRQKFGTSNAEDLRALGVTTNQVVDTIISGLQKIPPVTSGLRNSLENLGDLIQENLAKGGKALQPFVERFITDFATPVITKLGELAEGFQALPPSVQTGIVGIGAIAAATGPALFAIGSLAQSLTNIILLYEKLPAAAAVGNAALAAGPWIALGGAIIYAGFQLREYLNLRADAKAIDNSTSGLFFKTIDDLSNAGANMDSFRQRYRLLIDELKKNEGLPGPIPPATLRLLREANQELVQLAKTWVTPVAAATEKAGAATQATTGALGTLRAEIERVRAIRFEDRSLLNQVLSQEASGAVSRTVSRLVALRGEIDKLAISGDKPVISEEPILRAHGSVKELVAEIARIPGETRLVEDAWARVGLEIGRIRFPPELLDARDRLIKEAEENVKKGGKAWEKAQKEQERATRDAQRHVQRALHDTSRALTDILFDFDRAGETARRFGLTVAKSLSTEIIEAQLKKLTKSIIDFGTSLGNTGIGKVLGGLFGADLSKNAGGLIIKNATGAATSAASGAAGAASSASGAAGSVAAGIASSGLTAAVGAVAGAVSAVSSVISNFQLAGVNKSLDLIEKEVRYSQIHLLNILEKANDLWPWIRFGHDRVKQLVDSGVGVYNAPGWGPLQVAGSGGGTTINVDLRGANFGANTDARQVATEIAEAFARQLSLAGGIPG